MVANVLNNYDYGAAFDGIKYNNDASFNAGDGTPTSGFGHRSPAYQANQPRNAAVGVSFTF